MERERKKKKDLNSREKNELFKNLKWELGEASDFTEAPGSYFNWQSAPPEPQCIFMELQGSRRNVCEMLHPQLKQQWQQLC